MFVKVSAINDRIVQVDLVDQTSSPAPNTSVRRPHVPPPYVPDETDLMYMDGASDVDIAVPERPEQFQELHAAIDD